MDEEVKIKKIKEKIKQLEAKGQTVDELKEKLTEALMLKNLGLNSMATEKLQSLEKILEELEMGITRKTFKLKEITKGGTATFVSEDGDSIEARCYWSGNQKDLQKNDQIKLSQNFG